MRPLLTVTTDFGHRDGYVAAMKGVMLQIEPSLRIVDVTHEVAPHDVMEAAFLLHQTAPHFPSDTIHLVVVDPGVGTGRRPIAARLGSGVFVGPDNGLFSLLLDQNESTEVVVLDQPCYWGSHSPSATFHGRDLFAPVAAHLASGVPLDHVGTPTDHYEHLHWALPISDDEGIQGWVVHIDRFGNAITNIQAHLLDAHQDPTQVKCYVGSAIVEGIHRTYGDVAPGEPLVLVGSSGALEVAVNSGDAAALFSIQKGSPANLLYGDS